MCSTGRGWRKPSANATAWSRSNSSGCCSTSPAATDSCLLPGFAVAVDCNRGAGGRGHLQLVILAAEVVGHVPIGGRSVSRVLAAPHVLDGSGGAIAPDVGADDTARYRAAHRRDFLAAAPAHLVAQHASEQRAHGGAGHVGLAA